MISRDGLTIAVPRGALFRESLDLLDRLGLETGEVRANDRKLLFEDAGIVTMRPSDVPTYVEAGAADLGVTGKDVLAEQAEREVYELLDLAFGNAPTPGSTRASAAATRSGSGVSSTSAPTCSSAIRAEVTLPIP